MAYVPMRRAPSARSPRISGRRNGHFISRIYGGRIGGKAADGANYCVISMPLPGWAEQGLNARGADHGEV
jgi:hypothetical protein